MKRTYYIVGLPASGKTTFLAALGYCLINNENKQCKYTLGNFEDFDYISALSNRWAECEMLERTSMNTEEGIVLPLIDDNGDLVEIVVSDKSGEQFSNMVSERKIPIEKISEIEGSEKIILFVNPDNISSDVMISDVNEEFRVSSEDIVGFKEERYMHEQAEYVELLQAISELKRDTIYLKVVISAWDTYEGACKPEELLKEKMPLLWQYLASNKEKIICEFWGVSAQGGALDDSEIQEKLRNELYPSNRVIVVNEAGETSKDLTQILS